MSAGVQVTATCLTDDLKNQEIIGPISLQHGEEHWFSFSKIMF